VTTPAEVHEVTDRAYRVAQMHDDLATLVRAARFAVRTLSAAHTTGAQVAQVRAVLIVALREVSK
jgi:hypothetical protein